MSQQRGYTSALYSLDTTRAEFQLVATRDHVVLDVQAQNFGTDGCPHTQYALANVTVADARRLQRLLSEAIAASADVPDPRQMALWLNSSVAAVGDELRRGRLA
jgi:hypothetical protein